MPRPTDVKLADLKAGDTIELDGGFTCCKPGPVKIYANGDELYFNCSCGRHYLDGQLTGDGGLLGVVRKL